MQTQYVLKQAGLTLPVTKLFQQHIATLLAEQSQQTSVRAVVINFRDPDYSAESGGFHPVEMRFIRQDNEWYFDYVTDFSYMGRVSGTGKGNRFLLVGSLRLPLSDWRYFTGSREE
jgi:hypothetical protein